MAWSLEIHHIGLHSSGDATLVIARNSGGAAIGGVAQQAQIRSVLIDGGRATDQNRVHAYINTQLAGANLDAMVATHYDFDHFNGLRYLLRRGGAGGAANIYDNVFLFDQGRPDVFGLDSSYLAYLNAINLRGARSRITANVYSGPVLPPLGWGIPVPMGGWVPYNWLVGREILWTDNAGAPVTPAALLGAAAGTNANPPTITCISANQFVQGAAGANPVAGLAVDPKNEKSLAFVIRFNNFRYYIGGDIETPQENFIAQNLNPADNLAGRVLAMKTSHHGANTATSRGFIDRMRPEAAFISCGNQNQYFHPAQETVNILDGFDANPHAPGPLGPHGPYDPSPYFSVDHYLTGYQATAPPVPLSLGGRESITAGDPIAAPQILGHVALRVTLAQSNTAPAVGGGAGFFDVRFYDRLVPGLQNVTHT